MALTESHPTVTAPLKPITNSDMGGLVAILGGLSLSLILTAIPIRVYVRYKHGSYKRDDYMFSVATLFAMIQAVCVFYALSKGLGKSEELIPLSDVLALEKSIYISEILYLFALFFSKLSTALLLLRLTPERGHFYALWTTIGINTSWLVISALLIALRCHPKTPWTDILSSSHCANIFQRWEFVTALDVATELLLFVISVYLIWGVQMSMKSKTTVVTAFGCRLPLIAASLLHLHYLRFSLSSANPTLLSAATISCTQLEIGYSILASIMPCLKTFIAPYEPHTPHTSNYHYNSSKGSNNKLASAATSTYNTRSSQRIDSIISFNGDIGLERIVPTKTALFEGRLRPEETIYEATITHPDRVLRRSGESAESQRMIIKKGIEWSVNFDSRPRTTDTMGSMEYSPK